MAVSLRVKGEANRPEAVKAWHRLMAGDRPETTPKPRPIPEPKAVCVAALVSAYLADAEGRVSPEAFRGYRKFLRPFSAAYGQREAESVTATEAETFSRRPDWSNTYQAQFLGCLATCYRWAVARRLIASSPVEHTRKPVSRAAGNWLSLTVIPAVGREKAVAL